MVGIENYIGFITASVLLNMTPGSDSIYILSRSVAQGKKAGVYSVFGIISGCFVHTLLAAFGLSMILQTSAVAFNVVKYAGTAYLFYLGIKAILDRENIHYTQESTGNGLSNARIFRQGMLTNLLNPKVSLFFLSFLPHFINPAYSNNVLPFLILGITFMTTGTLWCLVLVFTSSGMTRLLRKKPVYNNYLQKLSGLVFIGLGVKVLLEGK